MWIGIICLAIAMLCRSISELQQHGKLKWEGKHTTFWGRNSWMRKHNFKGDMYNDLPPNNWYYRTFKLDYKERFPLSATFLVFVTDGMHLMQWAYHLFLAASLASFSGINFFWFWPAIPAVHALFYRIFQR